MGAKIAGVVCVVEGMEVHVVAVVVVIDEVEGEGGVEREEFSR